MKPPAITEGNGFLNYAWPELGLRITAERVTDEGSAELRFYSANESKEALLHITKANLLSTSTMNNLAKRLERNSQELPWVDILTFVTGKTVEIARRGDPVIEIWPSEESTLEVEYLVKPLIYLNHPTVIFGDYGSLKSLFSLVIAYVVQLPYNDNDLGLLTAKETTKCLYLDYEDYKRSF